MKGKILSRIVLPLLLVASMCSVLAPASFAAATVKAKASQSKARTSSKKAATIGMMVIGGQHAKENCEPGDTLTLRFLSKNELKDVSITDPAGEKTSVKDSSGKNVVIAKYEFKSEGTYTVSATDEKGSSTAYEITVSK